MSSVAQEIRPVQARTRPRRRTRIIAPVRRRFGLRTRLTVTFAMGAALLSAVLSITTFGLTRENLISQREQVAVDRSIADATRIASSIRVSTSATEAQQILAALPLADGSNAVIEVNSRWFATDGASFDENDIPASMRGDVADGGASKMISRIDGTASFIVGVPIGDTGSAYFEASSMADVQRSLDRLGLTLLIASILTTIGGGLVGFWASRRVFAPLLDVGTAAEAIAGGRLDTRLPVGGDPDLDIIANPFNEMAQALEDRIDRDARFASEVSHELRSPLMTIAATVEVLENTRDELPERAQTALLLLAADVDRLQQLVEDLLEISRFDVGAIKLHLEEVRAAEMVIQAVRVLGGGGVPVRFEPEVGEIIVRVDKRRFGRVIANLLDNAQRYAGGATAITIERVDDKVNIAVEDRGNGVPLDERDIIFDRFSRGAEGGNRSSDSGVGLGLALVDEHVRLHGGRVWVDDRRDGEIGARFVVELPILEPVTDSTAESIVENQ